MTTTESKHFRPIIPAASKSGFAVRFVITCGHNVLKAVRKGINVTRQRRPRRNATTRAVRKIQVVTPGGLGGNRSGRRFVATLRALLTDVIPRASTLDESTPTQPVIVPVINFGSRLKFVPIRQPSTII